MIWVLEMEDGIWILEMGFKFWIADGIYKLKKKSKVGMVQDDDHNVMNVLNI